MPSILLVALWALPGIDAQVSLLEGPPVAGVLTSFSADKVVITTPDKGAVELNASRILQVELTGQTVAPPGTGLQRIALVDGSFLLASQYLVADGNATFTTTSGIQTEARTRAIHWVRFKEPNEALDKSWDELVAKEVSSDLIVVRKDAALNSLEGTVQNITATHVVFKIDEDVVEVALAKVEGVVYFHPARQLLAPAALFVDVGGSRWAAKTFTSTAEQVEATTLSGVKATIPLAKLARLDFSSGKIVRLADLPYDLQRWSLPPDAGVLRTLPSAQALFGPRRDRWSEGDEGLVLAYHDAEGEKTKTIPDGLALRADTSLLYRLPPGSRRFTAIAGVDASVEASGEVKLVVLGDNRTLYEGLLARSRDPVNLDLDLTDVKRLQIRVERAPPLDMIHRLNLCSPRIWK